MFKQVVLGCLHWFLIIDVLFHVSCYNLVGSVTSFYCMVFLVFCGFIFWYCRHKFLL
jgi:hypothetical protein